MTSSDEPLTIDAEAGGATERPRGVGPLAIGSVVSGFAAFLVIAFGTRAVGEDAFAPVSVLWSLWALSAAAISFPVQHWTIRSAEISGEGALRRRLPRVAIAVGGVSVLACLASLALGDRLFATTPISFALMTGLLPVGSALVGVQRGLLAHRGRFVAVATSFAGENLVRAVVAASVLAAGAASPAAVAVLGWGIIGGFGIAVLFANAVVPRADLDPTRPSPSLRLLSGFAGANIAAQTSVTSGPILLSLLAASDAVVTQVFAVLALVRVPYTGLAGAAAAISGPLTRMAIDDLGRLRRLEHRAAGILVLLVLAGAALAPTVLPPMTRSLFATELSISATAQALLAAGGVLALGSLLEMLLLLAIGRPRRLLGAWMAGLGVGAIVLALPWDAVTRVSASFPLTMATAVTAMLVRQAPGPP